MAFEGPLEDRLLIRERIGAYADSAFQGDVDAWLANWRDDCVWFSLGGQEFRGKAAMREVWTGLWSTMDGMAFFTEIGAIEVSGDRAQARSYCREILFLKGGGVRKMVGAYRDELVRENGVWLFAERRYQLLKDEGAGAV
jgi:ketosteroid isomerase-like protein